MVTSRNFDAELRDLRRMFAQAPGFMCFLRGREHVFEIVNAAYLQLVGHRDVIGVTVRDALPEVVEQGFIELLNGVFDSGEPFIGHTLVLQLQRTPGGALEDGYVDFIYQPIRGDDGAVVGIFVLGQEVTAQHQAKT
ncbi:MAG: PAS domain-containing protein, partial [Kofleriaceae bacterium]